MVGKTTNDRINILNQIVDAVENNFSTEDLENNRVKWKEMKMDMIGVGRLAEEYIIRFTIEREMKE